jgi:hypothetical protein
VNHDGKVSFLEWVEEDLAQRAALNKKLAVFLVVLGMFTMVTFIVYLAASPDEDGGSHSDLATGSFYAFSFFIVAGLCLFAGAELWTAMFGAIVRKFRPFFCRTQGEGMRHSVLEIEME